MVVVVARSVEGEDERRRCRGVATCGCRSKRMQEHHAEPQGATAAALSAPFHPCVLAWASVDAAFKVVLVWPAPSPFHPFQPLRMHMHLCVRTPPSLWTHVGMPPPLPLGSLLGYAFLAFWNHDAVVVVALMRALAHGCTHTHARRERAGQSRHLQVLLCPPLCQWWCGGSATMSRTPPPSLTCFVLFSVLCEEESGVVLLVGATRLPPSLW